MATLILLRGHPGSGKSTAANRMFPNLVKFENDQFLMRDGKYCWSKESVQAAIKWCASSVETALQNSFDVVVANTFTKRRFIAAYEKLAMKYGAKFQVYRCTGNYQNVHGLNDEMVASFKNAMEDWPGEILI
jgi:predicted kinase